MRSLRPENLFLGQRIIQSFRSRGFAGARFREGRVSIASPSADHSGHRVAGSRARPPSSLNRFFVSESFRSEWKGGGKFWPWNGLNRFFVSESFRSNADRKSTR